MRLLLTADWHLGKKTHGKRNPETGLNSRLYDVEARVSEIAGRANREGADMVLFSGDAFENPTPTPTQQRILTDALKQFEMPVVMIPGNHDHPVTEGRSHAIDPFRELDNVWVIDEPQPLVVSYYSSHDQYYISEELPPQAYPKFVLCAMPWPLEQFGTDTDPNDEFQKEAGIWGRYRADIRAAGELAKKHGVPSVGLGHFTAEGSLPSGSEESMQMSREVTFSPSDFSQLDFTALGHIHKHQNVGSEENPVVYTSSPERLSFGEEEDPKGFLWLETDSMEWSFEETDARKFTTIEGGSDPITAAENANVDGHVVRVRYESQTPVDTGRLLEALSEAHSVASVENTAQTDRERSEPESYEGLSIPEMIERYAQERNLSGERTEQMLSLLPELRSDES